MQATDSIEQELKCALDQHGYESLHQRLHQHLGPPARLSQTNYFFDTKQGTLQHNLRSIRLRQENQSLVLTCKQLIQHTAEHQEQAEWELRLNPCMLAYALRQPQSLHHSIPLPAATYDLIRHQELMIIGSMHNDRLQWHSDALHLMLDRTEFPGSSIGYELEIEGDPQNFRHWKSQLRLWNIPWKPQPRSKLHRLVQAIKDLG